MPYVRRRKPAVPAANGPAAASPLVRPVLPPQVVRKPPPRKVPFPTLADNQSSIVLTVPTLGPLPPASRTVAPTIVSSSTHGNVATIVPTVSVVAPVQPNVHRHRAAPAHRHH